MRVYVTRRLPHSAVEIIRRAAEIEVWGEDRPVPRETLLEKIEQADGLLCMLTDRIDLELLNEAKRLKVVSQMAVGYDNIDVKTCKELGIKVGNTPGVLTETTADLAFALLLATARRVTESERYLREGNWKTWSPMLLVGPDVHHSTLGIIGMGGIGFEMARRAHGFQMEILYSGRSRNPDAEASFGAKFVPMETLLQSSDFVSIHTALNAETKHLMGAKEFAQMKETAILINTSRGGVVDQAALAQALQSGRIAGAGLDVFEIEPLPMDAPLLQLENVVLLPHIGSASVATRTKMAILAAENLVAGIRGLSLLHEVKC